MSTSHSDCPKDSTLGGKCPFCGSLSGVVYLHGHYQCVSCFINIDPCCQGEATPLVKDKVDKAGS